MTIETEKLQVISLIEIVDNEFNSITTFLVTKENEDEIVAKAENLFIKKIQENEAKINVNNKSYSNDLSYYLEEGYYIRGNLQLYFTWSTELNY
jgi:transposase